MLKTIDGEKLKRDNFDLLPDEMVIHTLSFVSDVDSLLDCRLVCTKWQALIDSHVFQEKASRENETVNNGRGYCSFSEIDAITVRKLDLPWYVFYAIVKYDPFNRNLVNNHCGQNGFKHWSSLPWLFEQPPSPDIPDDPDFNGIKSCFVANSDDMLYQIIGFERFGLTKTLMKFLQPEILVSVWSYNCIHSKCIFEATVHDDHNKLIDHLICSQWESPDFWTKVPLLFKNQDNTSTLIIYYNTLGCLCHGYNSKVSGFTVKVSLPIQLKSSKYQI